MTDHIIKAISGGVPSLLFGAFLTTAAYVGCAVHGATPWGGIAFGLGMVNTTFGAIRIGSSLLLRQLHAR